MKKIIKEIIATDQAGLEVLLQKKGEIFTFLNPVSYLQARNHISIFSAYDGVFADGGILVRFIQLLYGKKVTRRSFDMTSVAPVLFEYANQHKKTVFLLGSTEQAVGDAIKVVKSKYQSLTIAGFRNGYFNSIEEEERIASEIVSLNPDFVIVGMGAVKQESFLIKLKEKGFKGVGFTCGGFIHQLANNQIEYYPSLVNQLNLRFLYRMFKEKHTRSRYLKAAFVFPPVFLFDKWKARSEN